MTTKCFASRCKKSVEFRVFQRWDGKTVHTCAAHVPGNMRGKVANPTQPEARGAYNVYPLGMDGGLEDTVVKQSLSAWLTQGERPALRD
jgi:hypothetical protein